MKKLLVGLFFVTLALGGSLVASSAIAKDSHGSESHSSSESLSNNSSHGTENRSSETYQSGNESHSRTAEVPDSTSSVDGLIVPVPGTTVQGAAVK